MWCEVFPQRSVALTLGGPEAMGPRLRGDDDHQACAAIFVYARYMKTRSIEVDDDTAAALTQRAAERGVSLPELVAELMTLDAAPVAADAADSPGWTAAGSHSRRSKRWPTARRWCAGCRAGARRHSGAGAH